MSKLVECVPNVSEGRRLDVVERLAAAVRAVAGVKLLDLTSDADHNRSVLTFAGEPQAVGRAALALVGAAIQEIDLRTHTGVHPRIGAIDVIPFVPLAGSSMDECVRLAHHVGREIALRYGLPVYFYARAALRPERELLPDIRRPRFEGLPEVIATTHMPDAGPAQVHATAGAVAVGARPPLIAFNVELATDDLDVARRIAREIRESSGGLATVQALGLPLSNPPRAQISCNLLDHRVTSLSTLFRAIEARAAAAGVGIRRSELIGLLPLDAALAVAGDALRLDSLTRDRVIEARLLD